MRLHCLNIGGGGDNTASGIAAVAVECILSSCCWCRRSALHGRVIGRLVLLLSSRKELSSRKLVFVCGGGCLVVLLPFWESWGLDFLVTPGVKSVTRYKLSDPKVKDSCSKSLSSVGK